MVKDVEHFFMYLLTLKDIVCREAIFVSLPMFLCPVHAINFLRAGVSDVNIVIIFRIQS
jgi:hypothetical protein